MMKVRRVISLRRQVALPCQHPFDPYVFLLDNDIDRLRIIRHPGGGAGEANFKPPKVLPLCRSHRDAPNYETRSRRASRSSVYSILI